MADEIEWEQAFPSEGGACSGLHAHPGMSLLDYFAGQALQGCLAGMMSTNNDDLDLSYAGVARDCYGYATAMLAERKRRMG